jgi:hypothetical protein
LNSIIIASIEDHRKAGEDSFDGVEVIFDFSAFGRSISVRCSGGPRQDVMDGYQEAGS